MKPFQWLIFAICTLLWLGLSYLMLDLKGVTLYNILVSLMAGGIILLPMWKRWNKPSE